MLIAPDMSSKKTKKQKQKQKQKKKKAKEKGHWQNRAYTHFTSLEQMEYMHSISSI